MHAQNKLGAGGAGIKHRDLLFGMSLKRHVHSGKSAIHAARKLGGNSDGERAGGFLELLKPCSRRRARRVAGRFLLLHVVKHPLNVKILVVDEVFVTDADNERHAGQLDIVRAIRHRKNVATRVGDNAPLHAADPFRQTKYPIFKSALFALSPFNPCSIAEYEDFRRKTLTDTMISVLFNRKQ